MSGATSRFGALMAAVLMAATFSAGCIEGSEACDPACDPGATCLNGQCVTPVCELDCGTAGSCVIRADGTAGCACEAGYALNADGDACLDVDECAGGAVCDVAATCTNTDGSYTCTCPEFWTGDGMSGGCVSPCVATPCLNGGTCSELATAAGGFECSCAPGWTGDLCGDAEATCTPESCDDGDACTDDVCQGDSCTNTAIACDDSDACTQDSCNPASGCVYDAVICDDGDPCTIDSCDTGTGCIATPDLCDDGDPCTFDSCGAAGCANEVAQDIIDGRTYRFCPGPLVKQEAAEHCANELGWTLAALETQLESQNVGDAAAIAGFDAFWIDLTSNSGTWEWPDGPSVPAEEAWCIDEPATAAEGTCAVANACSGPNTWASASCDAIYAFVCELPGTPPDPCAPTNPCQNGGLCSDNGVGLPDCDCADGWTGPFCEEAAVVDPCDSEPCLNGGTCADNGDGTFTCTCANGWTGPTCEDNPCDPDPCQNGGTCMNDNQAAEGYTCECINNYSGKNCEVAPGGSGDCPTPCSEVGSSCPPTDCPAGGDECNCSMVPSAPPGDCASVGTTICTPGCSQGNCPDGFSCMGVKCIPSGGMSGGGGPGDGTP